MIDPFVSVDDMWRRGGIPSASLVRPAEADAFRASLHLERRDALWAINALRDEPLPLFAAAIDREWAMITEQQEQDGALRQMNGDSYALLLANGRMAAINKSAAIR